MLANKILDEVKKVAEAKSTLINNHTRLSSARVTKRKANDLIEKSLDILDALTEVKMSQNSISNVCSISQLRQNLYQLESHVNQAYKENDRFQTILRSSRNKRRTVLFNQEIFDLQQLVEQKDKVIQEQQSHLVILKWENATSKIDLEKEFQILKKMSSNRKKTFQICNDVMKKLKQNNDILRQKIFEQQKAHRKARIDSEQLMKTLDQKSKARHGYYKSSLKLLSTENDRVLHENMQLRSIANQQRGRLETAEKALEQRTKEVEILKKCDKENISIDNVFSKIVKERETLLDRICKKDEQIMKLNAQLETVKTNLSVRHKKSMSNTFIASSDHQILGLKDKLKRSLIRITELEMKNRELKTILLRKDKEYKFNQTRNFELQEECRQLRRFSQLTMTKY